MKHLNDILNEGILDIKDNDKNMDGRIENAASVKWILDHISANAPANAELVKKHLTVNKDGTVSIDMIVDLSIDEDMPDYVQFDDVYNISYKIVDKSKRDIKINLPKTTAAIKVVTYENRGKSLNLIMIADKGTDTPLVEIRGDIESIVFPKKFTCETLDLKTLEKLRFESCKLPKCKILNLPRVAVEEYVKRAWKIEADKIKLWN